MKSNHADYGFIYSVVNRRYASGDSVDLVVIGSGPGGYVAAVKAAQLGLNVSIKRFNIMFTINLYQTCFLNFTVYT